MEEGRGEDARLAGAVVSGAHPPTKLVAWPRAACDDDGRSDVLTGLEHLGGALGTLLPVRAQLGSPLLATHRVEEVRERRSGSRYKQCSGQAHCQTLATVNLCSPGSS